jgi:hypothetical protein
MNNFFKGLKNQISTFCVSADGCLSFNASLLFRKILLTLTNFGDFTGSSIRISTPHPPIRLAATQNSIHPLNKPTVNSPPDILKSNTVTRFKTKQIIESQAASCMPQHAI